MNYPKKQFNVDSGVAGPFEQTGMSEARRAQADARLSRIEALVDLAFEGLASAGATVRLIRSGFNLMRREVRVGDARSATTRLVG